MGYVIISQLKWVFLHVQISQIPKILDEKIQDEKIHVEKIQDEKIHVQISQGQMLHV